MGEREMERPWIIVDGNKAAVRVAYKLSEVIALFPTGQSTLKLSLDVLG
jgi:hypothetical protein